MLHHKPLLSAAARRTSLHRGMSPATVLRWYIIACPPCLQLGSTPSHAHTRHACHAEKGRSDATLARAISRRANDAGVNREIAISLRSAHGLRAKLQAEGSPAVQHQLRDRRGLCRRTKHLRIIDKRQPQNRQQRRSTRLAQTWRIPSLEQQSPAETMHWDSCSKTSDLVVLSQETIYVLGVKRQCLPKTSLSQV
jgi:hypothetical protein